MGGVALLLLSTLLALSFGVALSLLLRVRDGAGLVVAALLAAAAQLVLVSELLSIFSAWRSLALLLLQVASTAAVVSLAARRETSWPQLPARPEWLSIRGVWELVKRYPVEAFTFFVVGGLLLLQLVIAWQFPPNTYDSMTYHLTRILYWLQDDSLRQFANASERQATFPINAEIIQGWTMMLSGGDRFVQVVQWTAQLGLIAFVFAAAKDFGYRRLPAAFAAIAMLAMPIVVAQSNSSQNDLIVGFFAAGLLLFLMRGLRSGDNSAFVVSAIAAGLAVGTKSTGPLIVAAAGIAAVAYCGSDWRKLIRPAALVLAGIILLGSFNYVQNLSGRGSVLGSDVGDKDRISKVCQLPSNALQFGWYSVASLPRFSLGTLEEVAQKTAKIPTRAAWRIGCTDHEPLTVNHYGQEDRVSGGLPLLLLILPALVIALLRRRSREEFAYAVAAISLVALYIVLLLCNLWAGRFILVPAVLAAPLVARIAIRPGVRILTLILVLVSMLTMTMQNATKPLSNASGQNVFTMPYLTARTLPNPLEMGAITAVEQTVPKDGRLGIIGTEDSWEYPFAGKNLDRVLVRLAPDELKPGVIEKYGLDALLISRPVLDLPAGTKPHFQDPTHAVFLPDQGL